MSIATQIAADMATMIAVNPVTVTIGGVDVTGYRSVIRQSVQFAAAGELDTYQFSVRVTVAAMTAAGATTPTARSGTVVISGVTYRVLAVNPDPFGASIRMDLGGQYE